MRIKETKFDLPSMFSDFAKVFRTIENPEERWRIFETVLEYLNTGAVPYNTDETENKIFTGEKRALLDVSREISKKNFYIGMVEIDDSELLSCGQTTDTSEYKYSDRKDYFYLLESLMKYVIS